MAPRDPARISPTAHYTGYVWFRHGLSHPALRSRRGWVLFQALRGPIAAYQRLLSGPTLEALLLRRHRVLDHLLEEAIASGRVTQVVEIAAGLSPRGMRFRRRHPQLLYVEGDLPAMAERKRRTLAEAGLLGGRHHVIALDALADAGPDSLAAVAGRLLDPAGGTAILTEGLLNYFDRNTVTGLWGRFARVLAGFSDGLYLADLHVRDETLHLWAARAFKAALGRVTGGVHLDFATAEDARGALRDAGFGAAAVHRPEDFDGVVTLPPIGGGDIVRILAATPRRRTEP